MSEIVTGMLHKVSQAEREALKGAIIDYIKEAAPTPQAELAGAVLESMDLRGVVEFLAKHLPEY